MIRPKILVFASGSKDGGGSGFQEMVEYSRTDPAILNAEIVGVISNHAQGGVFQRAKKLGIPFIHFAGPFTAEAYHQIILKFPLAEWFMLSGWLKKVEGIREQNSDYNFRLGRIINIHPGPLPEFGGDGMYGHFVHEAVIKAFKAGEITQSAVTMHFVDPDYDTGPEIFQIPVLIREDDTPDTIASRVNEVERAWQSHVLSLVVNGTIRLNSSGNVVSTRDIF